MRASLYCAIGAAGIIAAGLASPAVADDVHSVARTLNAVLNPVDAQRLEDEARRNRRVEDERYWHNYRVGLEERGREHASPNAGGPHTPNRIGLDDARRFEDQARHNGRRDDERYWHNYAMGLEGRR